MIQEKLNRRDFLRLSAATATGVLVAACAPAAPATPPPAKPAEKPSEKPAEKEVPAEPTEKAEITFQDWGTLQQAWDSMKDKFADQHPDIEVSFNPTPDQATDKLLAQMVAGTAPDVYERCCDTLPMFAQKGQALDLRPYVERDLPDEVVDDWVPTQLKSFVWPDIWYSVPMYLGNLALFYNKDIFDEAGVDYPSATWDDAWDHDQYLEVLTKLTKRESNKTVTFGGWIGHWYSGKTEIRLADFGGGGVDPKDWTRCALGDEPAQQALEWLRMVMWDEQVSLRPDQRSG
jgi:multiple sugar transport system substrate-binding protein